jgi:predicted RNA-binding protein (virulence factor B family)
MRSLFFVKLKSVQDWQHGEGKQIARHIFHDGHTRHFFTIAELKAMLNEFNIIEIIESEDNYNGKNNVFIEAVVSK